MASDQNQQPIDDSGDLPWLTEADASLIAEELGFIEERSGNQHDRSGVHWFRPHVLDKYKNHKFCLIDIANPFSCNLAFLDYDKTQIVTAISFSIHGGGKNILVADKRNYLRGLPPKERAHWKKYEILQGLQSDK